LPAKVIKGLFKPGLGGILTDASGIIIIAITPIAILQKITLSCAFWAIATVVIAMVMVPILLSYMPLENPDRKKSRVTRILSPLLVFLLPICHYVWGIPYVDWLMIALFDALILCTYFLKNSHSDKSSLDSLLHITSRWLNRKGNI